MSTLVSYRLRDSVATITMDDGKVNALSSAMFTELRARQPALAALREAIDRDDAEYLARTAAQAAG